MEYENLKINGILRKVEPPTLVDRLEEASLVFPEEVYLTRIEIDQGNGQSTNMEIFGIVAQKHIGRKIELNESYKKIPDASVHSQEFYIDGEKMINTSIVKGS